MFSILKKYKQVSSDGHPHPPSGSGATCFAGLLGTFRSFDYQLLWTCIALETLSGFKMVYRFIRQLLNDERIIQKMADSSLMRQTARYFVSSVYRVKDLAESKRFSSAGQRVIRLSAIFKEEWKKALDRTKKLK